MAVDGFIPEVWSARILRALRTRLVAGQTGVVNTDYEGDIAQKGDTVRIGGIGAITVKAYTKNTDIDAPETLDDDMLALEITEGDYFNFQVDDVDARQAAVGLLDEASSDAGYQLAKAADVFVLDTMATDGTPATTSETDAYEILVDLGVQLDEADVPDDSRFAIVPPFWHGLLLKDERFVATGDLPAAAARFNGAVGEAAGFRILKSNNTGIDSSSSNVIAGHRIATSYAEQINKVEAYRPERRFADAVKGLHLYGAKVIRPTALVVYAANR